MPRRALGAPRGVGVLDQPSARYSHCHQCGEAEAGDERRAHPLMVECPGVMSERVPAGVENVATRKTRTSDRWPRAASADAVTTVVSVGKGIASPSPKRKSAISA